MVYTAYIVDACRTAGGKRNGAFRDTQATDLGAAVLDAIVERNGIDGAKIDQVIFGCVDQIGEQAGNVARMACLAAKKIPESVFATSVDNQCGSSQQAIQFAAQALMSGTCDVVVAGGVESMTRVPIGANVIDALKGGHGAPTIDSVGIQREYGEGIQFSQFGGAELLAKKYNMTKEECDQLAVESHAKAVVATKEGRFNREIVPLPGVKKDGTKIVHKTDEGIRPNTNMAGLSKLKVMAPGGILTPGTSSQICDGASALLMCNENGLKKLGLKPLAKVTWVKGVGSDPVVMLEGPVFVTKKMLEETGYTWDDIDLVEINEAFAPVPIAVEKACGLPRAKLNVNGGAMALGHPLGATGTKLMGTLVWELKRQNKKRGYLAICEGGGTANGTIIEICDDSKL